MLKKGEEEENRSWPLKEDEEEENCSNSCGRRRGYFSSVREELATKTPRKTLSARD